MRFAIWTQNQCAPLASPAPAEVHKLATRLGAEAGRPARKFQRCRAVRRNLWAAPQELANGDP